MTVRQLLYREIPAPFELREQVVGLVRHHGLPLWIMEREDPVRTLLKVSLEVNTEWLYILSLADALGRICADTDDLLYRLALFKALCIEQNCWGQERRFATAPARFSYFRKADQSADFVPYEDKADEVVILSGIAGSGKDHYIAQHYNNMPVISLDDMRRKGKIDRRDTRGNGRIIQAATEQARQYLRSAIPFVWNATNITLQMREQLVNTFAVYKPFIRLVYLEVPYAVLISQNKCREGSLPQAAIDRMIERLEVPKLWEAHEVQYIVR